MAEEINLHEVSISKLFITGEDCTYQIPVYQRNYAWEKDEIETLVQDVFDTYKKDKQCVYYIGTLVSYRRDDGIYEIIDGQQRLTTIYLILAVLGKHIKNRLAYRARKKSDKTLEKLNSLTTLEEKDKGIENGYKFAKLALEDKKDDDFISFFLDKVHIIHYVVPRDIDLNHYFEVMNSRGEQLEKHEIVKARLMQKLTKDECIIFNKIWQACSQMSVYVQDCLVFDAKNVFGENCNAFKPTDFEWFTKFDCNDYTGKKTIKQILKAENVEIPKEQDQKESFQPIIDFPNFLLIVLKITRMGEPSFAPVDFILDDKELINEFENAHLNREGVKAFAYSLLKAKFYLDNYIVHHSNEEDSLSNPWQLQTYTKGEKKGQRYLKNLSDDNNIQVKLVHLLSMFEVSFTARQRKNYLFYILDYLLNNHKSNLDSYVDFVEDLSDRYMYYIYLDKNNLNEINTPKPNSFDSEILDGNMFNNSDFPERGQEDFDLIYGDGTQKSAGIPLYVFNYLDYIIWKQYAPLRGKKLKETSVERKNLFEKLDCSDFGLKVFEDFYFSRTRRSLEHYYPQATADGKDGRLDENQINCFGNFAMISASANSMGSNWDPQTKIDHYLKDASGKVNRVGVSSLKFMVMMQMCKDHGKWDFDEIKQHQEKMVELLLSE